ncbi:hypothetical protein ABMC89_07455 [Sulfitobacter sp. HNIBRBA3233]|uniref:hypothetical protein n=1 Tax=Sulfitobacter marinivivus TaxID=3158558 RepID=UPI0032DE5C7D
MLIFLRRKLAFLANPKTGTTAVELALKPKAEIVFGKSRKHLTARRYAVKVAPFLDDTFGVRPEAVAVMRDPVDQIASWFRYRSGDRLMGSELSTAGLDFDDFVRELVSEDPPARARIGSQFAFLTDGGGQVMAEHVIAYENQPLFRSFLSERLKTDLTLKPKNVSPPAPTRLSDDTLALLKSARAAEFDLYARIRDAGDHLVTRIG